ncbi:unnamed protein product [Echinostoma caproni]|uniref:Post-GPI attachment to proteins factor 3 n=1 Tax=Echinostoma caproni TaxID=27848 RepID=A0A183AVU0_9TREM|nr:unnamed protein product [Echinostoma caproni]
MNRPSVLTGILAVLCCFDRSLASSGDQSYVRSFVEESITWSCKRECKYRCMWKTVEAFSRDNLSIPQFYGKWPFIRLFGIQEPASSGFSFLNFLAQLIFCLTSWLFSTLFHAHDMAITEALDYFGALAFILASIVTMQARVFFKYQLLRHACTVFLVGFFVNHVRYMSFVKFDYGYNMMVAVFFGEFARTVQVCRLYHDLDNASSSLLNPILFLIR